VVSKQLAHHELEFAYKIIEKWKLAMEKGGILSSHEYIFPPFGGDPPLEVREMLSELSCVTRNLEHLLITISGGRA
jgi:hypothetical protein